MVKTGNSGRHRERFDIIQVIYLGFHFLAQSYQKIQQ